MDQQINHHNFGKFKVAASIIEGYIILGGSEFLSLHASSVAKLFDAVVGNVNDRGLLSILPVIDVLIQVFFSRVLVYVANIMNITFSSTCYKLFLVS